MFLKVLKPANYRDFVQVPLAALHVTYLRNRATVGIPIREVVQQVVKSGQPQGIAQGIGPLWAHPP
jgi:hypothetical protein